MDRHAQAAAMLERLLAESPENPEVLQLLTFAYLGIPDLERALPCADRSIAVAPADGTGHRCRASILVLLGRMEEAGRSAVDAVELSPEDVWAHYVLVDVLLKSSRTAEAREAATRLLSLAAHWSSAHDAMGRVALEEKRHAEAEAHFRKALEIDPESAVAMNNLGAAFLQQKKYAKAVRLFWTSLRSRPLGSAVQYNLRQALTGHFGHAFFFAAALIAPPVFLFSLKSGIVTDKGAAIRVIRTYYLILAVVWVSFRVIRHSSLPVAVREHLWHTVHLPFWAGMRDLLVFCGVVSSFFQGIYLYLWWSRGISWAPGSPLAWRLFTGFMLFILACYAYVFRAWLRKRRLR
jgi:tetratricopeptide (TPR) repeat protein